MTYYKLTNRKYRTRSGTQWGEGVTHKATGSGTELCSADVIHVYDHPLKAAIFNPIHAAIVKPVLWECEIDKVVANDSLKVGVKSCTTIRQIPLPELTLNQRVRFAILCALKVYHEKSFTEWAKNWMDGNNRTAEAAEAAAWAAAEAAGAAEAAAEAAEAAEAAVRAAWAAGAAARAAGAAANIDFVSLIERAIGEEK